MFRISIPCKDNFSKLCYQNGFIKYRMGIENFFGFLFVAIMLNMTPGSDTIYILTRSITEGRKAGYYSVFGIVSGGLFHTVMASMGLSIILAKSEILFWILKSLGACYLCYLGIKALISRSEKRPIAEEGSNNKKVPLSKVYQDGVFTNVLNPKVAFFFVALLPQFVNSNNSYGILPFLVLGLTFMATSLTWCLTLSFFASRFSKTLRHSSKIQTIMNRASGVVFLFLGIKLLTAKQ